MSVRFWTLGSAGCQPAAFGSLPNVHSGAIQIEGSTNVGGKLPPTTG